MSDTIYTVVSGDTATKITKKFNISLDVFKKLNPTIKDVNKLSIGQKVKVGEEQVFESSVQFFDKTNKPLINTPYIIYLDNGVQFFGISDEKGFSDLIITDYQINISDMEFPIELKESVYEW